MEKDNKILLGAVLILLVAMVSFNFNTLTGEVTSSEKARATITASPSDVYFSYNDLNHQTTKKVDLTVNIENGEFVNEVWLYRFNGERIEKIDNHLCSPDGNTQSSYCRPRVYRLTASVSSNLEEGDYYFRIMSKASTGQVPKLPFNSNTITLTKFSSSNTYEVQ